MIKIEALFLRLLERKNEKCKISDQHWCNLVTDRTGYLMNYYQEKKKIKGEWDKDRHQALLRLSFLLQLYSAFSQRFASIWMFFHAFNTHCVFLLRRCKQYVFLLTCSFIFGRNTSRHCFLVWRIVFHLTYNCYI